VGGGVDHVAGDAAVAVRSDDDELGPPGELDQQAGGRGAPADPVDHDVGTVSGRTGETRVERGVFLLRDQLPAPESGRAVVHDVLQPGVDRDQNGVLVSASTLVWSGTASTGLGTGTDCSGWRATVSTFSGTYGRRSATDATWTQFSTVNCSAFRRLYCFER